MREAIRVAFIGNPLTEKDQTMAATKTVTPAEVNAAPGKLFELDDTELESLKSTRGRKEEQSVYLDVVRAAYEANDPERAFGISLTATLKAPWVMGQLRKAVKQLEKDSKSITIFDRSENKSKSHPNGFIAYKVKNEAVETPAAE